MTEELLQGLIRLFAIICNADGKLVEGEALYVNAFLEDYLGKQKTKKYRTLFIEYFKQINENADVSNQLDELADLINTNLTINQRFIVLVRLLEISIYNSEYLDSKKNLIRKFADLIYINQTELFFLESFVFAENIDEIDFHNCFYKYPNGHSVNTQTKDIKFNIASSDISFCIYHCSTYDLFFIKFFNTTKSLTIKNTQVKAFLIYVLECDSIINFENNEKLYFNEITYYFTRFKLKHQIYYQCKHVEYKFPNGKTGIHDFNLTVPLGRLVGILGASGAGKTTLMNVLSGKHKVNSGSIMLNNRPLRSEEVKGLIGYVTQEDVLIEELTVYENLLLGAELCFRDLTKLEILSKVEKTLLELGLYDIKDLKVGNFLNKEISGGQRKRLNIALDLVREPEILFLDEPTSGLSSKDAEILMHHLKRLTLNGKLIILVMHQPTLELFNMLDTVVIIDKGGRQIYNDTPLKAIDYFKENSKNLVHSKGGVLMAESANPSPDLIFSIIEEKFVDIYGKPTKERKHDSKYWESIFKSKFKPFIPASELENLENIEREILPPHFWKQVYIFIQRDLLAKTKNTQYLLVNLLIAPILAFIISGVIKYTALNSDTYKFINNDNIPSFIFISIIVSLFLGLSLSIGEIVKEKPLIKREKFLHLSRLGYLLSKISVLYAIIIFQIVLFVYISTYVLEIKNMDLYYFAVLFTMSSFSIISGLIVSSSFTSLVAVHIMVPLLLIPQMILSGAVFEYDKLNSIISDKKNVPMIADFIVARWGYEALALAQFKENKYQKPLFYIEQEEAEAYYVSSYWCKEILDEIDYLTLNYDQSENNKRRFETLLNNIRYADWCYHNVTFAKIKKYDLESLKIIKNEISYILKFYNHKARQLNFVKDDILIDVQKYKATHFNTSLSNLLKNRHGLVKITQTENDGLIRKYEPVFEKLPKHLKWYQMRAPLYSPVKNIFGVKIKTFWANLLMVWFFNVISFTLLYTDLIRKITRKLILAVLKKK